jgi:hypothetical protein
MMNPRPRLLIANHIDGSLLRQPDQRTFVQRIFWLAREGDMIGVPAPPDQDFLDHVSTLLKICKERLTILVAPDGQHEGRLFDPLSLTSADLINRLEPLVKDCSELLCLWPSVQVADLATRLKIEPAMPGVRFFSQGGDALANSKATFRAFAAACGKPIPRGTVCRTEEELDMAISALLEDVDGVMVKQAHNGAAAGRTVIRKDWRVAPRTAGSIWVDDLSELKDSIPQLWKWSSVENRFPVVVEELKLGCRTVWFEFRADDSQVAFRAAGGLEYDGGKLVREHTPLTWDIPQESLCTGLENARKLSELYRASGYRGYMSADGTIDSRGRVLFTEMNARIGGSLLIYGEIWERVVKRSDVVDRHVVQHLTPTHWPNIETGDVLERLARAGTLYDTETRTGAMLGIPPHSEIGDDSYLLCLVTHSGPKHQDLFAKIDAEFSRSRVPGEQS